MRRILLLLSCLLILSVPARAWDYLRLGCTETEPWCLEAPLGEARVYLFHSTTGSIASRFTIDVSGAPGTTFVAFESPYGNSGQLGGEQWVAYGACKTGTILVGSIDMVTACGPLRVGTGASLDCSGTETSADTYGSLCVWCRENPRCYPSPTEQSTWGAVKALYR
jgi:hypothetical protein